MCSHRGKRNIRAVPDAGVPLSPSHRLGDEENDSRGGGEGELDGILLQH